ncbi:hypothetical protein HOY80DRAFT_1028909 [Tuber brumale]|nr:hypothetical protein HOY80DRAFT_1028909 [Tuber brumale]
MEKKLEEQKEADQKSGQQKQKQAMIEDWALDMQPLQTIAIGIRMRFFSNYQKLRGEISEDSKKAIRIGNQAAHQGNVITDIGMIEHGHIEDTRTFYELYGIAHNTSQSYIESKGIVKMINKRATMQANPDRFSKKWDKNLQSDFSHILRYFDKASAQDWQWLEQDTKGPAPEREMVKNHRGVGRIDRGRYKNRFNPTPSCTGTQQVRFLLPGSIPVQRPADICGRPGIVNIIPVTPAPAVLSHRRYPDCQSIQPSAACHPRYIDDTPEKERSSNPPQPGLAVLFTYVLQPSTSQRSGISSSLSHG